MNGRKGGSGRSPLKGSTTIHGEKGAEMKTEGQSSLLLGNMEKIATNWEQSNVHISPTPMARDIIAIRSRSFNSTPCKKMIKVCDKHTPAIFPI